jgi:hypothetical protein
LRKAAIKMSPNNVANIVKILIFIGLQIKKVSVPSKKHTDLL